MYVAFSRAGQNLLVNAAELEAQAKAWDSISHTTNVWDALRANAVLGSMISVFPAGEMAARQQVAFRFLSSALAPGSNNRVAVTADGLGLTLLPAEAATTKCSRPTAICVRTGMVARQPSAPACLLDVDATGGRAENVDGPVEILMTHNRPDMWNFRITNTFQRRGRGARGPEQEQDAAEDHHECTFQADYLLQTRIPGTHIDEVDFVQSPPNKPLPNHIVARAEIDMHIITVRSGGEMKEKDHGTTTSAPATSPEGSGLLVGAVRKYVTGAMHARAAQIRSALEAHFLD